MSNKNANIFFVKKSGLITTNVYNWSRFLYAASGESGQVINCLIKFITAVRNELQEFSLRTFLIACILIRHKFDALTVEQLRQLRVTCFWQDSTTYETLEACVVAAWNCNSLLPALKMSLAAFFSLTMPSLSAERVCNRRKTNDERKLALMSTLCMHVCGTVANANPFFNCQKRSLIPG